MFRRARKDSDFADEIDAHLQLEQERLREQGFGDEDARALAHRAFGNVTRAQEHFHESGRWLWWDAFWQDTRYGLRMLRKSPGFAATAILTMAIGIGATTAIFSVVDATLLHPLPYPKPEQLVRIADDLPGADARDVGMSQPEWVDLQRSGIFDEVSPSQYDDNNLTGSSQPARVSLLIVAPNYFALLGTQPQLGRGFNTANHGPGFTEEAVISDGLWKRDFGADPRVLDRSLRLDTDLYRIVGVMPPGFYAPGATRRDREIEVWVATNFYGPPMVDQPPRSGRTLPTAIARLKPGLTVAAAQRRVDGLVASLRNRYPADYPSESGWAVRLVPLKDVVVGNVRQSLILLLGAVASVLLIGCVNIANLLLARAGARGREIAMRQALGAAPARLTRQMLTESVMLSLLGGIAGIALLLVAKGFLIRLVPDSLPRLSEMTISWRVLSFAMGASIAAGAIFGLAPALHSGRLDIIRMIKKEGRASTSSRGQTRTRRALVVAEFALSLVLMIGASLLLRSFWDLLNVRLGFSPQSVMTVRTRLPYPNDVKTDPYRTVSENTSFVREVLRRTGMLPRVEEAAMGDLGAVPLGHDRNNQTPPIPLILEGRETQGDQPSLIDRSIVTPEYFHLMGMTLLHGRLFTDLDDERAPAVAVINEAMAKRYWANDDALGKHFRLSANATSWSTVVGVVADARTESLEDANVPKFYSSIYQRSAKHLAIFLRGHLDAAAIPDQVREQVQAVDATIPVFGAETLSDTVSASLAERRFAMEAVALFALTALSLAGLGIYGVISYIVSERTHEIGIRLALGADRTTILQMILRQGLALAVAGTAVGLVGALLVSQLMAGLLYGVRPTDPPTFAGVAVLLVGVALGACYLPARRAIRVDPLSALRHE